MLFSLLLALLVILILLELLLILRRSRQISARDVAFIQNEWNAIETKFKNDPKHAVLEADKLLDFTLKRRGFSGSMGDKLKKAGDFFSDINSVWSAHKLRNRIAHEVGFEVTREEATRAHNAFQQALSDLGI